MQHLDPRSRSPCCSAKKAQSPLLFVLTLLPWFPRPSPSYDDSPPWFLSTVGDPVFQQKLSISFGFFLILYCQWKSRNIEVFGQCSILTIRPYLQRAPNPDAATRLGLARLYLTRPDPTRLDSTRLDWTRLDSTRLDSTRFDSTRLDSVRLDSTPLERETLQRENGGGWGRGRFGSRVKNWVKRTESRERDRRTDERIRRVVGRGEWKKRMAEARKAVDERKSERER